MQNLQHPDITRTLATGYPDPAYLEYEEEATGVEEEDFWPDGLSWEEWRKTH